MEPKQVVNNVEQEDYIPAPEMQPELDNSPTDVEIPSPQEASNLMSSQLSDDYKKAQSQVYALADMYNNPSLTFNDYGDLEKSYQQQLTNGQNDSARVFLENARKNRINEQNRQVQLDYIAGNAPDEDARQRATTLLGLNVLAERDYDPETNYGPEKDAVDMAHTMSELSPEQYTKTKNFGNVLGQLEDNNKKQAIITSFMESEKGKYDQESVLHKVWNWLGQIDPFTNIASATGILDDKVVSLDLLSKNNQLQTIRAKLDNASVEETPALLKQMRDEIGSNSGWLFENQLKVNDVLEQVRVASEERRLSTDAWHALDVAGIGDLAAAPIQLLKRGGKSFKGAGEFLLATGNEDQLANNAAARLTGKESALTDEEIKEIVLAPFANTVDNIPIGIGPKTDAVREAIVKADSELLGINSPDMFDNSEVGIMRQSLEAQVAKDYSGLPVVDTRFNNVNDVPQSNLLQGLHNLTVLVGRKTADGADGYLRKPYAERALKQYGLESDHSLWQDPSTAKWYLRKDITAEDPREFMRPVTLSNKKLDHAGGFLGYTNRFLASNSRILNDTSMQIAQGVQGTQEALLQRVYRPLSKDFFSAVKGADRDSFNSIWELGRQQSKWFDASELKNMGANDKVMAAYYAGRHIEDTNYRLFNYYLLRQKQLKGLKEVGIVNGNFTTDFAEGKLIPRTEYPIGRGLTFDARTNTFVNKPKEEFAKELDLNPDLIIVQYDKPVFVKGEPVRFVVAPKSMTNVRELSEVQLGYRPGGRTAYEGAYYLAQPKVGTYREAATATGRSKMFVAGKQTSAVGLSRVELASEAARRNDVWGRYKAVMQDGVINRSIKEVDPEELLVDFKDMYPQHKIDSLDDVKDLLDNRQIWDTEYEVVREGQELESIRKMRTGGFGSDYIDDLAEESVDTGAMQWLVERNGFQTKRGEGLTDLSGSRAPVMNPFEAAMKSINNALRYGTYQPFIESSITRWVKDAKAAKIISYQQGASDWAIFKNAAFVRQETTIGQKAAQKLKMEQEAISRILNTPSSAAIGYKQMMTNAAEWAEDVLYNNKYLKGLATRKIVDPITGDERVVRATRGLDILTKNPLEFGRAAAFHMKLGMFNPVQFVLQIQQAAIVSAIDPINGARSAAMYPVLRTWLVNSDENVLKNIAKRMSPAVGMSEDDFVKMAQMMKSDGFTEIGRTIMQADSLADNMYTNLVSSKVGAAMDYGRFFFDEGEKVNRITAYTMAWNRVRAKMGDGFEMVSDRGRKLVRDESEKLTFNMTSVNAAYWNKGILSVPTQFLSYQARALEALLPGSKFTMAERGRLAAGMFMFHGLAGVPAGQLLLGWTESLPGVKDNPVIQKQIMSGMWDAIIYGASDGELNTAIGERAGLGQGWSDFFQKISEPDNSRSFAETLGGPAATVVAVPALAGMQALTGLFSAGSVPAGALTNDLLYDMARNVSTFNTATKAYYLWNYEQVRSTRDLTPIASGVNKYQAILTLMGFDAMQERSYYTLLKDKKEMENMIDDLAQYPERKMRESFLAAQDGDFATVEKNRKLLDEYYTPLMNDPLIGQRVKQRAVQSIMRDSKSRLDETVNRVLQLDPDNVKANLLRNTKNAIQYDTERTQE